MIRKLLKVEFRDALSSMLPIGVGMVALSALVALTSVLTGRLGFHSGHWDWLNALLSFATGVCFIAVLVVCFAANVNRFFRMLGEEGYVQLVLPATMGQHIAAKLIAAVATTLLTFVFLAACTFLMALPTSVNAFAAFLRETGSAIHSLGLPASLLLALFVVLGIAIVYLHTYLHRNRQPVHPAPQAGEHHRVFRAAIHRADSVHAGHLLRRDAHGGLHGWSQPVRHQPAQQPKRGVESILRFARRRFGG